MKQDIIGFVPTLLYGILPSDDSLHFHANCSELVEKGHVFVVACKPSIKLFVEDPITKELIQINGPTDAE